MRSDNTNFKICGLAPWFFTAAMFLASFTALAASGQEKYFPEHPRVKEAVDKGIRFLESNNNYKKGDLVLTALVIVESSKRYNAVVPTNHPLVQQAAEHIVTEIESGELLKYDSLYYPCLSLILLCDLGDEKYREQILALLKEIVGRQEAFGGFTYYKHRGKYRGDTSQTQYVALALWVAHKHGFLIPDSVPQRALDWLLDVHQPNGSWYYDYINGGPADPRLDFTVSIHAACVGTVYLLSDYLQLNPRSSRRKAAVDKSKLLEGMEAGVALPPSVSIYVPPKEGELDGAKQVRNVKIDRGKLASVKTSANRYMVKNFEPFIDAWGYYYLYAFERYAFFRERAEGQVREIPDWYDQATVVLFDRQKDDGSFVVPRRGENSIYATSFAILFLVRSSEVLVAPGGESNLSGGVGLRPNARLDLAAGGRVKSFDVVSGLDDVMQMLGSEDIDEQQFEFIQESLTKTIGQLSSDKSRNRNAQMAFLRGLVTDRNYFRRLIAVKVLSRQQEFDNVPALIYALGDPDIRICAEAHNGLRLISRKLDSIPVSDQPDLSEYQSIKRAWTDWFLKIRPGAKLLD